jgi:undecaprenyl diphosphate synthase
MSDLSKINKNQLPQHIAIIMDGNGRWAKKQGFLNRIFGHKHALKSVREVTEGCVELGIKYLTLYAFSTENWNRPKEEVEALMELLINSLMDEVPGLHKNNIRVNSIGDMASLPIACQRQLNEAFELTKDNTGLTLTLALSYSGRWEITEATRRIAELVSKNQLDPKLITEQTISQFLSDPTLPDPELMIRTSGEFRISNFLLWQLAYSEIYITETLWPDFRKEDLVKAILNYQSRERRFGMTSEQLNGVQAG